MTVPSDMWLKQRAVIESLIVENVKPVDIYRRLHTVYGNQTLYISSIRRWAFTG